MSDPVIMASAVDLARSCNVEAIKLKKLIPALDHGRPLSAQEAKVVVSGAITLYEHLAGQVLLQATLFDTTPNPYEAPAQLTQPSFVPSRTGIWNRIRVALIKLLEKM